MISVRKNNNQSYSDFLFHNEFIYLLNLFFCSIQCQTLLLVFHEFDTVKIYSIFPSIVDLLKIFAIDFLLTFGKYELNLFCKIYMLEVRHL